MTGLRYRLQTPRSLIVSFCLSMALMLALAVVSVIAELTVIDRIWDVERVRDVVESMTERQRMAHAWMSASVDMVFPFAYGALLIGLNLRFLGRLGGVLAVMAAAAVPMDVIENAAQIIILHDGFYLLPFKAVVTPLKWGLIIPPLIGGTLALVIGGLGRLAR